MGLFQSSLFEVIKLCDMSLSLEVKFKVPTKQNGLLRGMDTELLQCGYLNVVNM